MNLDPNILKTFAAQLGSDYELSPKLRDALADTPLVMVGFGSIARPLADILVELGMRRFTLIDPKAYSERSVASQCHADEVGQCKVTAGQKSLGDRGASALAYACDAYTVPEGIIPGNSIVVASVDNRRGDLRANRMAARMRVRLLKLNVEPMFHLVAARAFDFRHLPLICAECQMTDQQYLDQRHPRSCDDAGEGRSTNSPRSLSQAAAHVGAVAIVEMVAGGASAASWYGHETQFYADSGRSQRSELQPKPDCRFDHGERWPNLQRLAAGPQSTTLRDLLGLRGSTYLAGIRVKFCQQVATEGRCNHCGIGVPGPRWLADAEAPLCTCPQCGGDVLAVPFWTFSQLSAEQLRTVIGAPLAAWGVAPGAVVQIDQEGQSQSFVLSVID